MPARRIHPLNTTPIAHMAGRWLARQLELDASGEKTLRFGFDIALSWTTGMALVAAVSFVLGCTIQGLGGALAAFALRVFSAGAHCRTAGRCAILTALVYPALGKVSVLIHHRVSFGYIVAAYALSAACTFRRARPRDQRDARNRALQPFALGILAVYLAGSFLRWRGSDGVDSVSCAIALGCLWQSATVTEAGTRVIHRIDGIMSALGLD